MTVLSYTNAFPGMPLPQHLSGQSSVQGFIYPGALQPRSTRPIVLSYTNAFPGILASQHLSGQSIVQDFVFPGALQPAPAEAAVSLLPFMIIDTPLVFV